MADFYLIARKRIDNSYKPMRNLYFERVEAIMRMRHLQNIYKENKYVILEFDYSDVKYDYLGELQR